MNTRHYYFRLLRTLALAALTAATAAACSDDTDNDREPLTPPNADGGIPVTFTANINPGSDAKPDTRTILTPTDGGGFTVTWKAKNDYPSHYDLIRIWAAEGNTLANSGIPKSYCPAVSAASSELVPDGESEKLTLPSAGNWMFAAIYGHSGAGGTGLAAAMVSPQEQVAPNNIEHIAMRDFSAATATKHVETGDMPDISLKFEHKLSALQLRVTNATDAELTVREIRLSVTGDKITTYKRYDVIAKDWITDGEQTSDYLKLEIYTPAALANDGTAQDFHMLLFPEPGHSRTNMTVTVITSRGEYSRTKPAPDGGFLAAKNYLTNIVIKTDGLTAEEKWVEYISNKAELIAFRDKVNNGNNYSGKTVRLAADINLAGETWTTPIGKEPANSFKGTFDGGGHLISNLSVDNGSTDRAGLFGNVSGGAVRNLCVSGNVKTTGNSAGGIVGTLSNGIMENCIFSGEVSGKQVAGGIAGTCSDNSRIAGCHTKGKVTATEERAGGIAGANGNNTTITDCYSEAEAVSTTHSAGGIVGYNGSTSTVTRCYATGQVSGTYGVGGIVGQQGDGTVTDCIALNPVLIRTEGTETTFGRIVGRKQNYSIVTITKCSAFAGMTLPDGVTATSAADDIHGAALTADDCLTGADYISCGMSADNGWAFHDAGPWAYLPYRNAFSTFPGITNPDEYRIAVPDHLKAPAIP